MAKNYVDTFNRQNQTMIEFHALPEMNYAFQIDQPMINGEYFFKFVDFYNNILEKQGFYSDEASPVQTPSFRYSQKQRTRSILDLFNLYIKHQCYMPLINFQTVNIA
jgi:hypothetical protein